MRFNILEQNIVNELYDKGVQLTQRIVSEWRLEKKESSGKDWMCIGTPPHSYINLKLELWIVRELKELERMGHATRGYSSSLIKKEGGL